MVIFHSYVKLPEGTRNMVYLTTKNFLNTTVTPHDHGIDMHFQSRTRPDRFTWILPGAGGSLALFLVISRY